MIFAALAVLVAAALLLVVLPSRFAGRPAALTGAAASLASLVLLALVPRTGPDQTWGEIDHAWIGPLGARLHLGVDAVSLPLALLTAFLTLLCCIWLLKPDTSRFLVALLLVVAAASIGVFASMDLLLFFIFFELALIPMWFVIARWGAGGAEARRAATRFLLFTVTGSAILLVGIVVIGLRAGSLQVDEIRGTKSVLAASLIALGLAVKVPLVPLHTWLPDAHSRAPTVGSVLLAGVFLKLGTYGMLRLNAQMLPESTARIAPYLGAVAVVGIVWAGLACLVQDDLKRLVAYSSVGHMGFVVLGVATLSQTGIAAAVFGSVAHGLITGMLFFLAGSLKERHGTASLRALGRGLYERTPWRAVAILLGGLATMGLPGFAGFWGELLALRATYEPNVGIERSLSWTLLGFATLGIALATAYIVRVVRNLLQGEPTPVEGDADLTRRETVVVVALLLPIVFLGLVPTVINDLLGAGVMGAP
ncbi:MAG: complex I subunit 4 family protein [Pseudonocardiaceae bacterium]